jgi:hypothetical protein
MAVSLPSAVRPLIPIGAIFVFQSAPSACSASDVWSTAKDLNCDTYAPGCMSKTSGPLPEASAGRSAATQSEMLTSLKLTLMSGYCLVNAVM